MLTGNYGDSDHDLGYSKARATTKIAMIPTIQAIRRPRAVTLARDISRIYETPCLLRWTPSFFIRLRRVLGLRFSKAAAPSDPSIRQLVCIRTASM